MDKALVLMHLPSSEENNKQNIKKKNLFLSLLIISHGNWFIPKKFCI